MLEMKKHKMLIGGKWVDPASGEWFESVNPYTAKPWALIPRGTKEDIDQAVAAAKCALKESHRSTPKCLSDYGKCNSEKTANARRE